MADQEHQGGGMRELGAEMLEVLGEVAHQQGWHALEQATDDVVSAARHFLEGAGHALAAADNGQTESPEAEEASRLSRHHAQRTLAGVALGGLLRLGAELAKARAARMRESSEAEQGVPLALPPAQIVEE